MKTNNNNVEQENLAKEQEITSLSHKNTMLEQELEKLEAGLKTAKADLEHHSQHGTENESLHRKLQVMEEENERLAKDLREAKEECVTLLGTVKSNVH